MDLDARIRQLREKKKSGGLTAAEKAALDALYVERSKQLLAQAAHHRAAPKPLVLEGCERGAVRRIMEAGARYSAYCRAKMVSYSSLAVCLADCAGAKGPGINPAGSPCHCLIEPAGLYGTGRR